MIDELLVITKIATTFREAVAVVGAGCHGPVGLTGCTFSHGMSLEAGKRLNNSMNRITLYVAMMRDINRKTP